MVKPNCDMLVAPLEALELHDAAHASGSARLHGLAARLMAVSGVEHLSVGSDLDEDAAACTPPLLVYESVSGVPQPLLESGLYDVCLLRRADRRVLDSGAVLPGHEVVFAPPVESGARKFPVVATPCEGEVRQVHVTDAGGALPNGVWLVSGGGDAPMVHDCLASGVEQAHKLPLTSRLARIPAPFREAARHIERPSDLCSLPRGRWMLRTVADPAFDGSLPLGLLYDAQAVRPGQYVRPPKPKGEPPEGETIIQRLPRGLRCQLHKRESDAWLFVGDRAVDCLDCLPQTREIVERLPVESAVLDCILTSGLSPANLADDLKRGKQRRKVAIEFVAFDCLYLDGEDLHERPLRERLSALGAQPSAGCGIAQQVDDLAPGCLVRPADCEYPLDWESDGWYRVPEERAKVADCAPIAEAATGPQEETPPATCDRQETLSREWFGAGGTEEPSLFWEDADTISIGVPFSECCLRMRQDSLGDSRSRSEHLETTKEPDAPPTGTAILGVQRDDMHEVFLSFRDQPERSGRYVWQWSDEDRMWECWRPKWQSPHLMSCDTDADLRDARKRGGWVAWNVGALRLLAESSLSSALPLNWETTFEDFEDMPDADFLVV